MVLLDKFLTMVFDFKEVEYEMRLAVTRTRVETGIKERGFKIGIRITTSLFMTFKGRQLLYRHFKEVAKFWYNDEDLNPSSAHCQDVTPPRRCRRSAI